MTIIRLPRKFKAGATLLDDVDENATPEAVIAAYSRTYPALANATVDPKPATENGALVFTVRLPDVQTKGARATTVKPNKPTAKKSATLQALDRWWQKTQDTAQRSNRLDRLFADLQRIAGKPVSAIDPFLLPMA